jgi:hypothetical protein
VIPVMPAVNLGPHFADELLWIVAYEQVKEFNTGIGCAPDQSAPTRQGHTMPRVNDMIESKYLKQGDVPDPVIVTVSKIGKINIAKEGDPPDDKWAVRFKEFNKPMLLNSTNIKLLEKACGSDDTDDWIGKEVVVYTDESVSFGGQVVGGLRIRRHQAEPSRRVVSSEKPLAEQDDDVPW